MNTWQQPEYKPDSTPHDISTNYPFWMLVDCYEVCAHDRKDTED